MNYNIPLFNLNFDEAEEKSAIDVIKSRWISSGPMCAQLEEDFCKMLDVRYAVALSNCTAALHLAVLTVGILPGDEVIVPSLTFVATVNAIRYAGGIPVFCDVCGAEKPVINANVIESLITPKTKAIIVMHYAGFACDMYSINHIAKQYNLKVIEDACHGPLSEYKGKKLGTIGNAGCFSFFSNKNISTGEGGMLVTNDENIYNQVRLLRSHGMTTMSYERAKGHSTNYDVVALGYNYRLDDIRAAIGIAQLKKLKSDIMKRINIRNLYIQHLEDIPELIIPFKNYADLSASYIFPLVLKNGTSKKRDFIRDYLAQNGIQTSIHYPPVHRFKIYQGFYQDNLPNTDYVADCEFTLPMYGSLTQGDVTYICDVLREGIEKTV